MPVTDLQPGQYIYTYHDSVTGSRPEVALNYFRVERVSNHFVWLVWEFEADHSFRKKREWIENNFYPVKPESYRPRIKLPPRTAQSKKVLGEIRLPDGRSFAVIYREDAPPFRVGDQSNYRVFAWSKSVTLNYLLRVGRNMLWLERP